MRGINRNKKIDNLRAIGIMLVILSHSGIPSFLKNLRTFDVVMMIVISAMAFIESTCKKGGVSFLKDRYGYFRYIAKRLKRLVLPTYIMLFLYAVLMNLLYYIVYKQLFFDLNTILSAILLLNDGSIGYVWIVRVFVLIALINPICNVISEKEKYISLPICALLYFVGILMYHFIKQHVGIIPQIIVDYLVYVLLYAPVSIIGMAFYRSGYKNEKELYGKNIITSKACYAIVFAFLFLLLQFTQYRNELFCMDNYKYPPYLYWITYGLMVSFILYICVPDRTTKRIEWISKNSFTIYLCHIPLLEILPRMIKNVNFSLINRIYNNPYTRFLLILIISILGTFMVNFILKKWKQFINRSKEKPELVIKNEETK